MRALLRLLPLLLAGCAAAHGPVLQGTWRSNPELSLVEVSKARGLSERQLRVLHSPGFFGELVLVFGEDTVTSILPYHRATDPYRILASGPDFVTLESTDSETGQRAAYRCLFRDGNLLVPVEDLGFYEVFSRVPPAPE
jgi:hypothetical protein